MSEKYKRILKWVGYGAFYVFALLFFSYLTFPFDRLRTRIETQFNAGQTGPNPLTLRLGHLSSYWFSGIQAENVDFVSPPTPPAADDATAKPTGPKIMRIDSVHARVALLHLLFGTTQINFGAEAFGGKISGYTSDADGGRKVDVEIADVSLKDAPILADLVGLPVAGQIVGEIEFMLPEGKLSKAEGKIDLKLAGLSAGDGKTKVLNAIALPKVELGDLTLQATATAGNLKIDQFSSAGRDLDLQGEGSVRMRDTLDASVMSLNARFKFSDKFTNKDEMTRGLFGAPGSSTPGLFDLVPENKHAKRPDGSYGWRISGTFGRPAFFPAANAGDFAKPH
ncbi:MAG: type II secretion system protein GspN [Pseudomonadota bacterium]